VQSASQDQSAQAPVAYQYQNMHQTDVSAGGYALNPKQQQLLECKSLYIGNLAPVVNQTLLYEVFSACGAIANVKVITDKVVCASECVLVLLLTSRPITAWAMASWIF
jgi:RNA recognition motif-containing protein